LNKQFKNFKKKNVFNQLNKEVSSEEGEILFSVTQASYFAVSSEARNNSFFMASAYL